MLYSRRTRRVLALAVMLLPASAQATARTWIGPDFGAWSNSGYWSPFGAPANFDDAYLGAAGGSGNIDISFDVAMSGAGLNSLTINSTGSGIIFANLYQTLAGTTMIASTEIVGSTIADNQYIQSAGTNDFSSLTVGNSVGNGTYSLSNAALLSGTTEVVGNAAFGSFAQSGGTNQIAGSLNLGAAGTGLGYYTLTGGTVNLSSASATINVAGFGSATFSQSGGTVSGGSGTAIFVGGGGSAVYTLSGSGTISVDTMGISTGSAGGATFSQSGGSVSVSTALTMGGNSGASGTYSLSGGTVSSSSQGIIVGYGGSGSFAQTGGTNLVSTQLTLGVLGGASGHYTLNASAGPALLNASTEVIGSSGTGRFDQQAGTNAVGNSLVVGFFAGSTGTYNLSGGTMNIGNSTVGGTLTVGYASTAATFNQSGGTLAFTPGGRLQTGLVGGTGTYNFSGGTINTDQFYVGFEGGGTFNQTGGTITSISSGTWRNLTVGVYGGSDNSSYTLSTGPASLTIDFESIGQGAPGTFTQSGNTTNTATRQLALGLAGGTGTYNMQGGTLTAATLNVGGPGPGTFDQTGGAVTLSPYGGTVSTSSTSGPAIYLFQGGTLSVPNGVNAFVVDANGTFSQQGNCTFSGYLTDNGLFHYLFGTFSGTLDIAPSGNVSLANAFFPTGGVINRGSITLTGYETLGATSPSTLDNQAVLGLGGGSLGGSGALINDGSLTGWGTIGGSGGLVNNALLTQGAGTLVLANTGTNINNGTVNLAAAREFQLASNLSNAGTLNLNSALVTGGGSLVNSPGGVLAGPGNLSPATFTNAGTLLVPAGTTRITPTFSNSGAIVLNDPAANLNGGMLTNSGTVQGVGRISSALVNSGTVEALGGTLIVGGLLTNSATGLLRVSMGNKLLVAGSFPANAGTISLTGGTLDTNNQPLTNNGQITGFGTLATGGAGLTNAGSIYFSGGLSTINGAVTNNAAKTVKVEYNPAIFTGAVTNNGTINVVSTNALFAGGISGNPAAEPTGVASSASVLPSSFTPFAGDLTVSPGGGLTASYLRQNSLTNSGAVTIRPAAQGGDTSVLSALTLNAGSSLDVADTRLVWDYTATSPVQTLRQYLQSSLLNSSTAAADSLHREGLGYADNVLLNATVWGGQAVDSTALLTRLTYLGDATLDGIINADDYALIDRGYARYSAGLIAPGTATWTSGDFNYDGVVNAADYLLIDRSMILQSGPLSPSLLAQRESQFGAAYVQELLASVPEPASLAWLAAPLLLCRRRRRAVTSV